MNDYSVLGLYEHNVVSYEKIKEGFQNGNIVSIVHATGTGKSYNALQLAYDNKDKKIVYIAPSNSIIEHLKEIIEKNSNLDLERDFPNLEFKTYQSLINLSENELVELNVDLLILDEFHHIGAPVWGERVNKIVESHKNMKILGMTAYTVRDRGTSYERDMVNFEKNELFSKSVVSNYDLCDAMIDGVLSKPVYKSGYVYLEQTADAIEQRLEKLNHESNDYKELYPILKEIKKELHECLSLKDILKVNIKKNGKYIYFCPLGIEDRQNDINTIMEEARGWISEIGLSNDEYEFYVSTSKMGEVGKKNREAFYNDEDLEIVGEIIKKIEPDYYEDFKNVMNGHSYYYANMMICRHNLLKSYADWLFRIIFETEKYIDMKKYNDTYQSRVFGFISERLLQVWVEHHKLKVKEYCVFNTDERGDTVITKNIGRIQRIIKRNG